MLWVSAVSRAPSLSDDSPRRARLHGEEQGEVEVAVELALGLGDEAGHLRLLALVLGRRLRRLRVAPALLGERRRLGGALALPVGAALVHQRQRARDERGGEEDRHRGERPGEPAPGARLALEPPADLLVLAVGDPLAGGDELADQRRDLLGGGP